MVTSRKTNTLRATAPPASASGTSTHQPKPQSMQGIYQLAALPVSRTSCVRTASPPASDAIGTEAVEAAAMWRVRIKTAMDIKNRLMLATSHAAQVAGHKRIGRLSLVPAGRDSRPGRGTSVAYGAPLAKDAQVPRAAVSLVGKGQEDDRLSRMPAHGSVPWHPMVAARAQSVKCAARPRLLQSHQTAQYSVTLQHSSRLHIQRVLKNISVS
jgi:hypothetical protein